MAVTRYRFRLLTYLLTVVIGALIAASPRLISWAVSGRPREYVSVELDGKRRTTTLSALANDILDRVLPPFEVSIKEVKKPRTEQEDAAVE
jgi:hypothetical protein